MAFGVSAALTSVRTVSLFCLLVCLCEILGSAIGDDET
jgi:hypothetical protein